MKTNWLFIGALVLATTFVSLYLDYTRDEGYSEIPPLDKIIEQKTLPNGLAEHEPTPAQNPKTEEMWIPSDIQRQEKISLTVDKNDVEPGTEVHIAARLKEGTKGSLKDVLFVPVGDGTVICRDRYTLFSDGFGMTVRIPDDFIGEVWFGAVGFVDDEPAVSNIVMIVSGLGTKGGEER